jgi:nucleoside-diphosphate-sugar epimerase
MSADKVLVTGVYGLVAGEVYKGLQGQGQYDVYGLARRRQPSDRVAEGEGVEVPEDRFFLADLSDFDAVRQAVEGVDVVVHMGANPDPDAPWEAILQSNMIGAYNTFEACRQAGVKRVVYASSTMVNWCYQFDEPYKAIRECRFEDVPDPIPIVTHEDPPRPSEPYSASKVWGEALARTYCDSHGMSCICLRIGWVNKEDRSYDRSLDAVWCSQRDILQLVERCVSAPEALRFDIFYGMSDNKYRWVDIEHAREMVGYVPQDRAEDRI